jgi:uncharacterized protein YbjT (DUF2867 family)
MPSPVELHKAVVVGASGGVGRWIVSVLLSDPRVGRVTAVSRRSLPDDAAAAYYMAAPEVAAVKLRQAAVDFGALNATVFAGHTLGFSALGLYTQDAESEAHFRAVEVDCNVAAAAAMHAGGVRRYAYLSGQGVRQDGGLVMFARVKGAAEKALQARGFERATMVRPGAIRKRAGPVKAGLMYGLAERLMPAFLSVEAQSVAKAMVASTLRGAVGEKEIWENKQIKREAQAYDESLTGPPSSSPES